MEKSKMFQVNSLAMRGEPVEKISELSGLSQSDVSETIAKRMHYSAYLQLCKQRKIVELLLKNGGKTTYQIAQETGYTFTFVNQVAKTTSKEKQEMRTFNSTPYTDSEIEKIIKLKNNGSSDAVIGKEVGRTAGAISVKVSLLRKEGKIKSGKYENKKLAPLTPTVPLNTQIEIYKMWSQGKSKADIAAVGYNITQLEQIWSSVSGLTSANEKFELDVMELYSEEKDVAEIAKELNADATRVYDVISKMNPKIETPVKDKKIVSMWTTEDVNTLIRMVNAGKSGKEIAAAVGRSEQSVYDKISHERKAGKLPSGRLSGNRWPVTAPAVVEPVSEPISTPIVEATVYAAPAQIATNASWGEPVVEPATYSNPIVVHVNDKKEFADIFDKLAKIDREIVIHL